MRVSPSCEIEVRNDQRVVGPDVGGGECGSDLRATEIAVGGRAEPQSAGDLFTAAVSLSTRPGEHSGASIVGGLQSSQSVQKRVVAASLQFSQPSHRLTECRKRLSEKVENVVAVWQRVGMPFGSRENHELRAGDLPSP